LPAAETQRNPAEFFFQETFGDFAEELETANEQGKSGIMLFFEEEGCPYCAWMKQKVLNQPRVQDWYRKHFLLFTVDIRGDNELTDFDGTTKSAKRLASSYNRRELTPTIAFFGPQGDLVYRKLGVVRTADEFLWLGEFVVGGHYKRTKFTRFKREKLKTGKATGNTVP
jgi:thioredoxin-related protein